MKTGFFQNLNALHPLEPGLEEEFRNLVQRRVFSRGYHLLNFGEVDRNMHFLIRGAGRVYYERDGLDVSDYLALDGHFLGAVPSLFNGLPSDKAIELLEESEVETVSYARVLQLAERYPGLGHALYRIVLFAFLEVQERMESFRFQSAAERYAQLERKYPGISNRVPLRHLASYLNITQVSLSRIRAGLQ